MKREFLEELKLEADVIEKIMAENGKDINSAKAKFADYDDLKAQLAKANETLEKFSDYDQTKADVEKYKAEAETARKEAEQKFARLELQAKIKDFTSGKKFVNELTRNAINSELEKALEDGKNKGKSLDDLLKEMTDGKENIFLDEKKPTPPVVDKMAGGNTDNYDDALARKVMGLPPRETK